MAKISQKELQRLKSLKGELIGTGFIEDVRFILDKEGKKGLAKIEKAMAQFGCPRYQEIEDFKWYSVGCYLISLLLAKEFFGWSDKKFREMGAAAIKISLISRMMMRYFISIRRCFEEAPRYWTMYFTTGKLETGEINEKEGYLFLILKDFPGHQIFCRYFEGVVEQVTSYVVKKSKCREVKCCLKGEGKTHLFKVTWEK